MNLLNVLLQAAPAAKSGFDPTQIIFIVLLIAVFYLFLIRPQQKRAKEERKFRESLQPGSEVVVAGGIYGKVKEVKDRVFIVEIADNVRIKVEKNSVFAAAPAPETK